MGLGPGSFPILPLCRPLSRTIRLPSAPLVGEPFQLTYDPETCLTSFCQQIAAGDCALSGQGDFLCDLGLPLPNPFASPDSPCVLMITYLVNQTQVKKPCGVVYEPTLLANSNQALHNIFIYATVNLNVANMALVSASGNLSLSTLDCSLKAVTPVIPFAFQCKCLQNAPTCLNPVRDLVTRGAEALNLALGQVVVLVGNVVTSRSLGFSLIPDNLWTLALTSLTYSPLDSPVLPIYSPGDNKICITKPLAGLEVLVYLDPKTCGDTDGYYVRVNSSSSCANGLCTITAPLPAPTIPAANATGCLLMGFYKTLLLGNRYVPLGRVVVASRNLDYFLAMTTLLNLNALTSITSTANSSLTLTAGVDYTVTALGNSILDLAFGALGSLQAFKCTCISPGCLQRVTQALIPGQPCNFVSTLGGVLQPVLSLALAPWELACDGDLVSVQLDTYFSILPGNVIVLARLPSRAGMHIYLNETQCHVSYHEFIRPENCVMQNGYAFCTLTRALPQVVAADCSVYASVCALGVTVNVTLGVMARLDVNFDPNRFEFSCSQGLVSSAINQVYLVDGLLQKVFLNSSLIHCSHRNTWCGAHGETAHRYQCSCTNSDCGFTRSASNFMQLFTPVCGLIPLGFFNQQLALPPTPSQCVFPSIPTASPTTSSPTFSPTPPTLPQETPPPTPKPTKQPATKPTSKPPTCPSCQNQINAANLANVPFAILALAVVLI